MADLKIAPGDLVKIDGRRGLAIVISIEKDHLSGHPDDYGYLHHFVVTSMLYVDLSIIKEYCSIGEVNMCYELIESAKV
jgi:hypothetical protein